MIDWQRLRYWIFDLDGTLTRPILDFPKIKAELGLPGHMGILEAMAGTSPEEREKISRKLDALEWETAGQAESAEGAQLLLEKLSAKKVTLGIVTRNKREHAIRTLSATGLHAFFRTEDIIGREQAPPKPDPAGIQRLLDAWGASFRQAVMVGDFCFDLEAGRAARVATLYVDGSGAFPHRAMADLAVKNLAVVADFL